MSPSAGITVKSHKHLQSLTGLPLKYTHGLHGFKCNFTSLVMEPEVFSRTPNDWDYRGTICGEHCVEEMCDEDTKRLLALCSGTVSGLVLNNDSWQLSSSRHLLNSSTSWTQTRRRRPQHAKLYGQTTQLKTPSPQEMVSVRSRRVATAP